MKSKQTITLISIGDGDPELLNLKPIRVIKEAQRLVLRTGRHPLSSWLLEQNISFSTLDAFYESAEDFQQLNADIAEYLWKTAAKAPVVYAVTDLILDRSVSQLYELRPENAIITVIPGSGISDLQSLSIRPFLPCADLRVVSAYDFLSEEYDPNISLLVTELDNAILAGEIKAKVADFLDDEHRVFCLHHPDPVVVIPLYELDRRKTFDHLSAVMIPGSGYADRNRYVITDLLRIMERLRAPDGCPWDSAQTHASLRPYLIEEAWECVASIDQDDPVHLSEELGDLLFQIVFHSSIGKAYDEFSFPDIVNSICRKMLFRHPHLFQRPGDASQRPDPLSPADWETLKRSEAGIRTVSESLDDVSESLPALGFASKIFKRARQLNPHEESASDLLNDIMKQSEKLRQCQNKFSEKEMGTFLLLCAKLCFRLGFDGELLLHNAAAEYKKQLQSSDV